MAADETINIEVKSNLGELNKDIGNTSKLKSALMLEDIKLSKKEGDWYISSIQKDGEITIE